MKRNLRLLGPLFLASLFQFCPSVHSQAGAYNDDDKFFYTLTGGFEQVDLSSQPSQTEPFVRLFVQSGAPSWGPSKEGQQRYRAALWTSIRLLGSPNQNDTKGIFSVFTDPSGQITTDKLSSIGTAVDFAFGPSFVIHRFRSGLHDEIDGTIGFGATTPLQSNTVNQAFQMPTFGTVECGTLFQKFGKTLSNLGVRQSPNGVATGVTNACLVNSNASSMANGITTFAPVNVLAFSSTDRTSFFLKDFVGLRLNHPIKYPDDDKTTATDVSWYLGTADFTFGMDSSITGGVFRGNRWIFKTDAIYPVLTKGRAAIYILGSFSTRLQRNVTDNSPLILQAASLATLSTTTAGSVPNVNTIVLSLQQPDRDFYRIGVAIDVISLIKKP